MTTLGVENKPRNTHKTLWGTALLAVSSIILGFVYAQFRGDFIPTTKLTMVAARAGLVMDPGSKVTYNGVQVGRVAAISETTHDGKPAAKFVLDVDPQYLPLIPANVSATIDATTVFGNKYVSLTSPKNFAPQHITPRDVIDATAVTTEFNTLFQTLYSIAEKIDPVKVNLTLSAAAQALNGLGERFGQSLVNGDTILDHLNPRMGQLRHDVQQFADLSDTYTHASPDLWSFLANATITARRLTAQQHDLDAALLSAAGFGTTGADIIDRGGPYLVRAVADLVPTAALLDTYSPELLCAIRNIAEAAPIVKDVESGNGYSARLSAEILGSENPYIYPDNLPRVNAHGGPGGRPGCWQHITRDLWPAPFLVMDTGTSIAPYNHFEIGSPYAIDYVWGRQVGENTINP